MAQNFLSPCPLPGWLSGQSTPEAGLGWEHRSVASLPELSFAPSFSVICRLAPGRFSATPSGCTCPRADPQGLRGGAGTLGARSGPRLGLGCLQEAGLREWQGLAERRGRSLAVTFGDLP